VLQSFEWDSDRTHVGDSTGEALADALSSNQVLQSFEWNAYETQVGDNTDIRMLESMQQNYMLKRAHVPASLVKTNQHIKELLLRNRELPGQVQVLKQIAPRGDNVSLSGFKDLMFHPNVLKFFCPPGAHCFLRRVAAARPVEGAEAGEADPAGEVPQGTGAAEGGTVEDAAAAEAAEEVQKPATEEAEVLAAIQQSKAAGRPLSGDGVVLLRLTRMARSPEVLEALMTSAALDSCRQRVTQAGCEIAPSGCGGAKFLVP